MLEGFISDATRRLGENNHVSLVRFHMELLQLDDDDKPFNLNYPNNRSHLASFTLNDDRSTQLLTMGMAAGVREAPSEEVSTVQDVLFKDGLSFDDLYQLFEFGLNSYEHWNLN